MKVYAKIRQNGEYHSQNISQAVYGFREMGAEIVRYQKISDIYESVTKEDIVLDYITQVEMILKKFGVVPACEDYPVELRKFMGRFNQYSSGKMGGFCKTGKKQSIYRTCDSLIKGFDRLWKLL